MESSHHRSAQHSGGSDRSSSATSTSTGPVLLTTAVSSNKTLLPQAGDVLSIEVQARNPRRRFPLADEFLPHVTITQTQIELLKRQCLVEMNRVLRKSNAVWAQSEQMFDAGSSDWQSHFSSKQHHLTMYRRKKEDGTPAKRSFLARGQVSSVSLKDLEYGLYGDTTTDERAVKTDLYRDLFLDAAVLEVFEAQRPDDMFHFFGLKWLACISPADKFLSPRDYASVEYSRTVETQSGEKLLIKVVLPVDSDIVESLPEREYDLVRGAMACTSMYRYDASARAVQVFAEGSIDPSGSATSWMGKSFLSVFAPTIVNLENCADVKHFMKHGRVLSTDDFHTKIQEAKQSQAHTHCGACLKKFGTNLMSKKSHASCRCCGQFMCSKCVIPFTLCLPWHERRDAHHPSAVMDEKFCLKCVCLVRAHRNEAVAVQQPSQQQQQQQQQLQQQQHQQHKHQQQQKPTAAQTFVRQMELLNFEEAPLLSRQVIDDAHQKNHKTKASGSRFVEDRLRQMKERHLVKDKHRNRHGQYGDDQDEPAAAAAASAAFDKMEKSIAQQSELLRNMQYEQAKREYQQRIAYQQQQQHQHQNAQLYGQQQYYLQHAAALSASQASNSNSHSSSARTSSSSTAHWNPSVVSSSSSSMYTADTFESFDGSDPDDDVFSIAEDSNGFVVPSPRRDKQQQRAQCRP